MTAKVAAILCSCIFASSCGRYADFTLVTGEIKPVTWKWSAEARPVFWEPAAVDTLNPTVANGKLFYSVFDGKSWHTALEDTRVLSPDSRSWEGDYIAANGTVIYRNGEYLQWYHAAGPSIPKIGFARSKDGKVWQKHPSPVLDQGPRGSWDERGVADPYVIEAGGQLWMFFLGQDRAHRQRLGVARSSDGITWTKLRTNPVIEKGSSSEFDELGLGEPAVWHSHGMWWMLYTGRDRKEVRRMGLAKSRDICNWEKVPESVIEGDQSWNVKTVCDAHTEIQPDGRVKVWFGGGDVAHPAERVNGKIGIGWLTPQ